MLRQRSTPWIQRKSRFIIATIAAFGAVVTAYLTIVKLTGGSAACPVTGCDKVLSSPYAVVFGLPLALFGFLAYSGMGTMAVAPWLINQESQKELRQKAEYWTWLLMFAGGVAMMIFSSYLMYLMAFKIQSLCLYCIASGVCSLSLFLLTIVGHSWEDIGQLMFTGLIVGMITIIGTLGVYAPLNNPQAGTQETYGVTTASNPANIALAEHLTQVGAKMYGAFWCDHCKTQKQLFGKEAVTKLTYIECDSKGKNAQPQLCQAANIKGYPTWEVNGQQYSGVQRLDKLAELSGYTGSQSFGNP
ncbi:vitamin K epoxide reductase family protein [Limnoraphis robusta]|uniref:vitamin K epoxide reductase family protein n=1 Tax=Limnoraphis robusta TaxID=1118279 RepID=UPI002B1FE4F5|nr:vitamin K epoxide reductase family protein [Limnoraphis robusta]MEA5496781.1 vitamin K epoxide reductase family protein [Limnoraphis robusta BA-68 BA1]